MGKSGGIGRALTKSSRSHGKFSDRHTTGTNEDFSRLPVRSITEENSLSEFFNIAELANSDFTAQKKTFRLISQNDISGVPSVVSRLKSDELQKSYQNLLKIPRRPKWTRDMSADELFRLEKEELLTWRRSLVKLEETEGIMLTPFEKNIQFWRQLWRVVERSDVLVQIVDARQPLLYYCSDLETYTREVDPNKVCVVLVNKADFLTPEQRSCWSKYFQSVGIRAIFWSATLAATHTPSHLDNLTELPESDCDSLSTSGEQELEFNEEYSDSSEGTAKNDSCSISEPDTPDVGVQENQTTRHSAKNRDSGDRNASKSQHADNSSDSITDEKFTRLFGAEELLDLLQHDIYPANTPRLSESHLTVGFVGYPNVGKSSTMNALMGCKKTAVSATPGRTKHFQTLCVRPGLILCDCPGLVMPSFVYSKADLVVAGILSIDEMRDCLSPIGLICEQIPRSVLEFKYGINLPKPKLDVIPDSSQPEPPPTPHELLAAHAFSHSFMTAKGNPHYDRSARLILKDYAQGRLLYCHPPPNVDAQEFQLLGRQQNGLPPSLSHSHMTKAARPRRTGSRLDPSVISEFDRLAFKVNPPTSSHVRSRKRIVVRLAAGSSMAEGDDQDDRLSSVSSCSSWSTVSSGVGGSSLLSGAESTTPSTVAGGSGPVKKPWRVVSQSKRAQGSGSTRQGNSKKQRDKLRRVYHHLDEHERT